MQTSVATAPDIGVPGQIATQHTMSDGSIVARTSEEGSAAIPFGVAVMQGTTGDRMAKLVATTAAKLVGLAVFGQGYMRDTELTSAGLQPGVTFDVGESGNYFVRVEDAVTPASEVHVRAVTGGASGYGTAGAEQKGAFRGTADGVDCIDCSAFCRYVTSADAGGIAEISVDFRNSALQAAD